MRVTFIHVAPLEAGKGTERFFVTLGNHLAARGHTVSYLWDEGFSGQRLAPPTRVDFESYPIRFLRSGAMFHPLGSSVDRTHPDVIYLNTFTLYPLGFLLRTPLVLGTHTFGREDMFDSSGHLRRSRQVKLGCLRFASRFVYPLNSTIIHALNHSQSNWLRDVGFSAYDIRVIALPVDDMFYQPDPTAWRSSNRFVVLYVGGIDESKGFLDFLRIHEGLDRALKGRFDSIAIGWGSLEQTARAFEAGHANFHFAGALSDDQKRIHYNSASVLVSPSHSENFHVVTAEAQLCGLPVISSDLPGPRSQIVDREMGCLVPRGSVETFVRAVLEYHDLWLRPKEYLVSRGNISKRARERSGSHTLKLLEGMLLAAAQRRAKAGG